MSEYWPVIIIILQLIFLEGILSIDNAAIIGALVSPLPDKEDVPWPNALKGLGRILHPMLGSQRTAALRQYEECQRLLAAEVGGLPEQETTALYEAIKARKIGERGLRLEDRARSPITSASRPCITRRP